MNINNAEKLQSAAGGRVLSVQNIPVNKTNSGQIKINTQYLNPGMYFVHLVNTRYQTVATQKIIKQ